MKNKLLAITLAIVLSLTSLGIVKAYQYNGNGYGNLASDFYSRSTKFYDAEVFSRSDGYGGRITVQNEVKFEHNFQSQIDYPVYRNYDNYQYYPSNYGSGNYNNRNYNSNYYNNGPGVTYYPSSTSYRRQPQFFYDNLN